MIDTELNVKEIACVEFPMMIETGWDTFDNREELLNKYLAEIPKNVDTLVLRLHSLSTYKKRYRR